MITNLGGKIGLGQANSVAKLKHLGLGKNYPKMIMRLKIIDSHIQLRNHLPKSKRKHVKSAKFQPKFADNLRS